MEHLPIRFSVAAFPSRFPWRNPRYTFLYPQEPLPKETFIDQKILE
jgi:hypothetical protein